MSNFSLTSNFWGWHPFYEACFQDFVSNQPHSLVLQPARIVASFQGFYRVALNDQPTPSDMLAEPSGKYRHTALPHDYPEVGDWVVVDKPEGVTDRLRIHGVLPRRSVFRRTKAGTQSQSQVVAANIDTVFVVTSLNDDLNLRRLERYLTLAWESAAEPVIVLSKIDQNMEQLPQALSDIHAIALGCEVVALSALSGEGVETLGPWLKPKRTLALIGSSGVGKSTLMNRLLGEQKMKTQVIRDDDSKGKHTTTHRELFRLPQGALLIDTPGMRELRLHYSENALSQTFQDIEELSNACRFRDCQHAQEKGCAIQSAIAEGVLTTERLRSFQKQAKENAWLERREKPEMRAREKQRWKGVTKMMRQRAKQK